MGKDFYFDVKNVGETKIIVKAGELTDESVIKKVDTFNEDYRLKDEGDVINWFEIATPAGYFSINDTLGDIMATLGGKLFLVKMLMLFMASSSTLTLLRVLNAFVILKVTFVFSCCELS